MSVGAVSLSFQHCRMFGLAGFLLLTQSGVSEPVFLSFCASQPDLAANEAQLLRKIQLLCLMEVRSTQGSLSWYLTVLVG